MKVKIKIEDPSSKQDNKILNEFYNFLIKSKKLDFKLGDLKFDDMEIAKLGQTSAEAKLLSIEITLKND